MGRRNPGTGDPHIVSTPSVCGGRSRVRGHRIRVLDVALWHDRLGLTPEEIASRYGLSLGQVHSALAYYYDHVRELQEEIRAGDRLERKLRAKAPSLVKKNRGA